LVATRYPAGSSTAPGRRTGSLMIEHATQSYGFASAAAARARVGFLMGNDVMGNGSWPIPCTTHVKPQPRLLVTLS
jgi:hypothetical protein